MASSSGVRLVGEGETYGILILAGVVVEKVRVGSCRNGCED